MLACEIDFRGVKAIRTKEGRRIYIFPAPGWNMCVPGVVKLFVRKEELQHMTTGSLFSSVVNHRRFVVDLRVKVNKFWKLGHVLSAIYYCLLSS